MYICKLLIPDECSEEALLNDTEDEIRTIIFINI
jgi:hypothetical protein